MKNKLHNKNSNSRIKLVLEELKNCLPIIIGITELSAQDDLNLDYYEEKATSNEDIIAIQELKRSLANIDKKAEVYRKNIGNITTKTQKQNSQNVSTTSHAIDATKTITNNPINIEQTTYKNNINYETER